LDHIAGKEATHSTKMKMVPALLIIILSVMGISVWGDSTSRYGFLYTSSTRTYQSSCQAVLVPPSTVAMRVELYGGSGGRNRLGSQSLGGKGGGRADMAQAGGTDPQGLPAALAGVQAWVGERL
jgi:hypothetical protein